MSRASVISEDDLRWAEHSHEEKFGYRRKSLSAASGGEKLGCGLYEVEPGRRTWPYHYHGDNEEAIYVLEGSGTLRVNDQEISLEKGDYATFPASAENAHQPDAVVYPDSGKVGVFVGSAPGGPKEERTLSGFFKVVDGVDYYEGES